MIQTFVAAFLALGLLTSCGSKYLKYDKESDLKDMKEFNQKVDIVIPEEPTDAAAVAPGPVVEEAKTTSATTTTPQVPAVESKKTGRSKAKVSKLKAPRSLKGKTGTAKPVGPTRRQPELESDQGFEGRRPLRDPFRVGEKVVHKVHYYSVSAGSLDMQVKPFAQVNGRKAYNFNINIKTSNWYSSIYSVDDRMTTLVDFETMVPWVFQLHVRETGQLRESRMLFDKNQATFWERKVTKKDGEEEKKLNWEILDYSQNIFSGIFYMRTFQWPLGVENAFRVADNGKNMIFRGKAIRKEKLSTDIGDFDSIVVQPQIELAGKFEPVGDIFIWLSDDDRKFILRIEAKIKIGTLVSEVIELKPGTP